MQLLCFVQREKHRLLCQLVQFILHQGIGYDTQPENCQDQIENAAVAGGKSTGRFYLINGIALLVEPVPHVDVAGDDAQQNDHAAGSGIGITCQLVDIFCQFVDPVQAIDAAGHNRQNDAQGNVSLFDGAAVGVAVEYRRRCLGRNVVVRNCSVGSRCFIGQRGSAACTECCAVRIVAAAFRTNHKYSPLI